MTAFMPTYFEANGHKDLQDARHAPFSFAYQCDGTTYFQFLNKPENERMANAFNATMALQKQGEEESFVSSYPVSERLSIYNAERVLFVDVGGGVGHQLLKFQARAEGLKGKMMLFDLPGVISQADSVPEDVVKVGHDFFQPLPEAVWGAKAFYLRNILHDWPQTQASVILKNIADAVVEDSVVLIHEIMLPETGVSYFDAMIDWHMMDIGALERTQEQWKMLVGSVGLEIKGIWKEEEGLKGLRVLMECGLKS